ncbi:hypothetical protein C0995_002798 [Termitomyces sp. Mi166|nr:hypothetical protein C0995_002798 [Termitomyces sp. Mi166\
MPSTPPCPFTRPFTELYSVLSRPPTPRTSRSLPAKHRKLANGNKENFSPAKEVVITPVIDCILASSPSATKVSLGKRCFEEDSSEDERSIVESLVIPPEVDVFLVIHTSKPTLNADNEKPAKSTMKKRKRIIMDAVEMPPLSQAYTRTLGPSASFELLHTLMVIKRSVRRTRSESKVSSASSDRTRSNKQRKRVERYSDEGTEVEEEEEEVFNIGAVPLRALVALENHASFYPYSLVR